MRSFQLKLAQFTLTSPAKRQGRGGLCTSGQVVGKDQNDLRRQSRRGYQRGTLCPLFWEAVRRDQKRKAGFPFEGKQLRCRHG